MSNEKEYMVSTSLLMIAEKKLFEAEGEIERLEKEIDELDDFLCPLFLRDEYGNISCRTNQGKEIERLEKENEKLRRCVEFYAEYSEGEEWWNFDTCKTLGELARQTLKELGEVESE